MRLIDIILGRLGYIRQPEAQRLIDERIEEVCAEYSAALTEDDLAKMLAQKLGVQDVIDEEYEKKIFKDLKGSDGLVQYLREAAARDKDRYFGAASKEEQLVIRGAFARTAYLRAKIMGADDKKPDTKVKGVKYG